MNALDQRDLDNLPVMRHNSDGHGWPQTELAADWMGVPITLGASLSPEQAEKLSAHKGWRLNGDLEFDAAGYVLDDATGYVLHIYSVDPLSA